MLRGGKWCRFWAIYVIKNCKQDTQGIGPLRNSQTGTTCTTSVSPLRLDQLCESTIKDGLTNGSVKDNVPGKFKPKIPDMPNISISLAEIHKLLSNLNTTKAAGPDAIKPVVLDSK